MKATGPPWWVKLSDLLGSLFDNLEDVGMKEKHGEYIAIYWEDDCDLEYVRGHVTLAEARAALEFGCGRGCGDFAHSVTHRWARWQPAPRSSDFDSLFVARDDQARGCFAVTEVKLGKKMAPDVLAA